MAEMKILILGDLGLVDEASVKSEAMSKRTGDFGQYGAEVAYVTDPSLLSRGNSYSEAILRVEKEGADWVAYTPEVLEAVGDADVLVVHYSAVGAELIKAAPRLKFVGVLRSGAENVNVAECFARGIKVSVTPGRLSEPVSDFTVAMILALNRGISAGDLSKRAGWFVEPKRQPLLMKDATFGLVGLGQIGAKVARRLSAFGGPRILAYDPFVKGEDALSMGVEPVELGTLMAESDFVSVHARLTKETRGLIGEKEIALMKPDGCFVNTARAGLVDEGALLRALQGGKIRGAALDVYSEEPLGEDHPLRKLDNVILTPHIAGRAGDTLSMSFDILAEEMHRFLKGEPLKNCVN
ncbi:MAG: 2-hydroxyacid dehydrogenase [Lachnospiraceae bacterium]|nr:2-hydroxyacid dehydrogenase [Lachnospiraceae bacterium]